MNKHLQTLMQKEMTRKEFLSVLGLGIASIFGFSSVIRLLNGKSPLLHNRQSGYGSRLYGK